MSECLYAFLNGALVFVLFLGLTTAITNFNLSKVKLILYPTFAVIIILAFNVYALNKPLTACKKTNKKVVACLK